MPTDKHDNALIRHGQKDGTDWETTDDPRVIEDAWRKDTEAEDEHHDQ